MFSWSSNRAERLEDAEEGEGGKKSSTGVEEFVRRDLGVAGAEAVREAVDVDVDADGSSGCIGKPGSWMLRMTPLSSVSVKGGADKVRGRRGGDGARVVGWDEDGVGMIPETPGLDFSEINIAQKQY